MRNSRKCMINLISNQNCGVIQLMISFEHKEAKNSVVGTTLSHTVHEWEGK